MTSIITVKAVQTGNWEIESYPKELVIVIEDDESYLIPSIHSLPPQPVMPEPPPAPSVVNYESPLKQIKLGILIDEITCKENFVLIQKHDGSPACVKSSTAERLIERGWTDAESPSHGGDVKSFDNYEIKNIPEFVDTMNVIKANNQFAIDFYSKVSQESDENIFFSPWSISTAAAIVYEGARGNTAEEMQQVFGFSSDTITRQSEFQSTNYLLNQKSSEYRLDVANALWIQEGFTPHKEYVDIAHNYYDSTVDTVDFTTNGVDIINQWVTQKTQEKIKELFLPGPRPDTKLAITNAIYFNGTWVNPFDAERTDDAPFWITPEDSIDIPMMNLRTTFLNSTWTENLLILQLPYRGDKLSMMILLPHEKDGLASLETTLSAENLIEWQNSLHRSKVVVHMPKFELETDYNLKPILQNLGMIDAFSAADFSGISNSGLFIDEAVHKAFVNVNEKGTEVAAVTGFTMNESEPMPIKIDHPFLFLIQDDTTGNILFIGRVMNPSE